MTTDKDVFVIMPFSTTRTASATEWTETFEHIFVPAIEHCGYSCRRAQVGTGSLITSIIEDLRNSRVVLADITDQNPNVFYELGVRHALSRRTIIISQRTEDIPSDLKGYWTIVYGRSPGEVTKFRNEISRVLTDIEKNPERSDSPVADLLERDNVSVYAIVQRENAKKLTALYTEITGNIISLKHGIQTRNFDRPIFTSCLGMLLQTLYVDLGANALRNSYELMHALSLLESKKGDDAFVTKVIRQLEELGMTTWAARERLAQGSFSEPEAISTLIWTNENLERGETGTCEELFTKSNKENESPFSMYCTMVGISGRNREQAIAEEVIGRSEHLGKRIVLVSIRMPGWIYGQCSYRRTKDDVSSLKFSNTIKNMQSQHVLPILRNEGSLDAIILADATISESIGTYLEDQGLADITHCWDGNLIRPLAKANSQKSRRQAG